MINDSILENLAIHNDNLSAYYIGSVIITVLLVVITWYFHRSFSTNSESASINLHGKNVDSEEDITVEKKPDLGENLTDEKVISQIKTARFLLAEEVAAYMTDQQLEEEKEVEKQQLEAIFQLLQNQQDKYQVSSMEELEDQLRLYR